MNSVDNKESDKTWHKEIEKKQASVAESHPQEKHVEVDPSVKGDKSETIRKTEGIGIKDS